ncbi:WD40/YVTN/BNR-like repeat-containing protein [Pseudomonas chlororaphis]|uniref:Photosystem I reaction center subunit IV n=1 Tax=Pseudomonas chlororaphis TaxID=587753 RepID=A0A1Q8EN30_9PSED|nr:YCF48-related protein [Pseudomonas chlororaphis]OLF53200.1 photosystem I reaction center subunit IV [Pseudomonas chlororaphis]
MAIFAKPVRGLLWAVCIAASAVRAETPGLPQATIDPARIILLDIQRVGSQLFSAGERGWILRSTDDGGHWQAIRTPADRTLTGLAFADERLGIAVGHGATLLRTTDGGQQWTAIPVEDIGHDSLLGVTHLGGQHFVAYGAFGHYLESLDGGSSWSRKTVLNEDFDRHIAKVLKAGPDLFLFGESGTLLRSRDLGQNWEALQSPYEGSFFGGLQTPSGALLAFGMRGNLYRSSDQGQSWQLIPLSVKVAVQGGQVLSDGRIALVGNAGLLALSQDDGRSFSLSKAAHGGLSQIVAVADGALAVGETGVQYLSLTKTTAN